MNWQETIQKENLRIRHLRCNGRLQATIIYRRSEVVDEPVPYGMSVVSKRDQPITERGRLIAYARFLKACKSKMQRSDSKYYRDNPLSKLLKMQIPLSGYVSPAEIKLMIQEFKSKTLNLDILGTNSEDNCCRSEQETTCSCQ